jgi:hypothetical protein
MRTRPDGRGRHQTAGHRMGGQRTAGHRTGGQQTADRRTLWTTTPGDRTPDGWTARSRTPETGWVDTACWTPATDAVAWLLAGSTTATTLELSLPAERSSGHTPSGRATTRTAPQQGLRGHPRCHRRVWPPPRPSAAGSTTPPSSWRLGALLSSGDYGSSVERSAKLKCYGSESVVAEGQRLVLRGRRSAWQQVAGLSATGTSAAGCSGKVQRLAWIHR